MVRGAPSTRTSGCLLDVQRDVVGPGEVVAGPQRQDAEHRALEVVAAVERGDHGVQAAVTAGHHDPSGAGAVQCAVELAGVRRSLAPRPSVRSGAHVSALSSDSSSAVPASLLVITRSGSIGGDPILWCRPTTPPRRTPARMPAIAIIGAQWGDEGKGKATDVLGSRVDYVVKFNGGNNAGHTVVIGAGETQEKYALHLLPSGILTPGLHAGDRQRRGRRPQRAVPGDRRARGARRRHLAAQGSAPTRTSSPTTTAPSTRSPSASSARAGSAPPAAASVRRTPTR